MNNPFIYETKASEVMTEYVNILLKYLFRKERNWTLKLEKGESHLGTVQNGKHEIAFVQYVSIVKIS